MLWCLDEAAEEAVDGDELIVLSPESDALSRSAL